MGKIVELTKELLVNKKTIEELEKSASDKNATDNIKQRYEKELEKNKSIKAELKEELKKELTPTGKLSRINGLINDEKLDTENYEFMLKLVAKDKELEKQLNELKALKDLKDKQTNLEILRTNFKETIDEIDKLIEGLEITTAPKTNIPGLKFLSQKKQERSNKSILRTKYDQIIKAIEDSRARTEDKNLKEEYASRQNLKDTLDILYKHCQLGDIEEIKALKQIVDVKYETILNSVDKDIGKCAEQYRRDRTKLEKYDPRLREYIYQKKNNYVTYAIERLSCRPFVKYDLETHEASVSEPNEGHELIIFSLIALYELGLDKEEKPKFKMTYVGKIDPKSALTKNAVLPNKIKQPEKKTK